MKCIQLLFLPLFAVALYAPSCAPKNRLYASGGGAPQCLKDKIATFSKSAGSCETGASLKEYTFQNKTVYVFDPGQCGADMTSPVLDADCNDMGSLGGFTGNTKINGEDFSKAVYVKTVWSN
jgi:hypothetical protein